MGLIGVVAVDKNYCIGKDGKIPWKIKEDLMFFKTLTTNHIVIMGRKTYDSLPIKPLPNRVNIVITNKPYINKLENVFYCSTDSLDHTYYHYYADILGIFPDKQPFVIGGLEIFKLLKDNIMEFYVSRINIEVENGTTFLPKDFFDSYKTFNTMEFPIIIDKVQTGTFMVEYLIKNPEYIYGK